jgi:hypothetical protein
MTTELWRPIPLWEGFYEVSDQGRVRSLDRIVKTAAGPRRYLGKMLRPGTNRHGYPVVVLSRAGRRGKTAKVHRLVLEAFVGPCPDGMEGCHNNGDRADARLPNLRWDTPSANQYDRRLHGTDHQVAKTECPQGHPYDDENTKVIPSRPTARYCRACHHTNSRRKNAA